MNKKTVYIVIDQADDNYILSIHETLKGAQDDILDYILENVYDETEWGELAAEHGVKGDLDTYLKLIDFNPADYKDEFDLKIVERTLEN